jgi:hypothetical protein
MSTKPGQLHFFLFAEWDQVLQRMNAPPQPIFPA